MIRLEHVRKEIKRNLILEDINYTFKKGMIYGLCGPNGSGKTMILRMISGLVVPSDGRIQINGQELHKDISFPPSVGIIIENMELLPNMDAEENLRLLAKIKKTAGEDDIKNALDRVGLHTDKKVKKYSLGMRQRLNIAQAVFEKPDIILLDEPTNALDEDGTELVYRLLEEEKQRGACIIMATHNRSDFSTVCDRILKVSDRRMEETGDEN